MTLSQRARNHANRVALVVPPLFNVSKVYHKQGMFYVCLHGDITLTQREGSYTN